MATKTEEKIIEKTEKADTVNQKVETKETKEKMVEIIMLNDPVLSDSTRIVAVNELAYRIPYGVPVKVEECIANVIRDYNKKIQNIQIKKTKALAKIDRVL